jgi:hypothetical protein
MKKTNPLIVITLLLVSVLFSSCEVIEGIFKAGMGFGIFIVIAVIVLIVGIIFKIRETQLTHNF